MLFFLFTFLCIIPTIWRLEQTSQMKVTVIQFTIHLQSGVCKCHTLPLGQGSVVTIKQHSVNMSPNIIINNTRLTHQPTMHNATSAKTRLICLWWQKIPVIIHSKLIYRRLSWYNKESLHLFLMITLVYDQHYSSMIKFNLQSHAAIILWVLRIKSFFMTR